MTHDLDRRRLLKALAVAGAAGLLPTEFSPAHAASSLTLGAPETFSFDGLKNVAERMAREPFTPPPQPDPDIVSKIDYERWGQIHFNTDSALFANGPGQFPVTFFHIGKFFPKSVEMYVVEGGQARPILYDQAMFDMPPDSPARLLPKAIGFAGFRIQEPRDRKLDWRKNDWAAFLGAAYFRAIGELYQYGLSARGVAVDTAVAGRDEDFPDFTHFYIEAPTSNDTIVVNALLNGASVTGAYRFTMTRGKGVVMTDRAHAQPAQGHRAPRHRAADHHVLVLRDQEGHRDRLAAGGARFGRARACGLARGERIWRPLNNPERTTASAFADQSPRGYGTLQRDRVFDHYLDGVYLRSPTEPLGRSPSDDWGQGAVQLIEIPTDDEIHDNVVATWVPADPATAGKSLRLQVQAALGAPTSPIRRRWPAASQPGSGAAASPACPAPPGVRKFMVEFLGGPLEHLPFGVKPEAVLYTSRGHFTSYLYTEAVPDGVNGHWRAQFDLVVDGTDPVEMRCHLKTGNDILTETWAFQYHPVLRSRRAR